MELEVSEPEMTQFWKDEFIKNKIVHYSEAQATGIANKMINIWYVAGMTFNELKEDFIAYTGETPSPMNKSKGKEWFKILKKSKYPGIGEMPPLIIVQSTLKYFKIKGPFLNHIAINEEEDERHRLNDSRVIFIRKNTTLTSMTPDLSFFKSIFPKAGCLIQAREFYKLVYDKRCSKENDLTKYRSLNPNDEKIKNIELARQPPTPPNRGGEIVYKKLVIRNFPSKTFKNMELHKDLHTCFPSMTDYLEKDDIIILYFENIQKAYEAFQNGKEFDICNWRCNVLYDRKHLPRKEIVMKEEKWRLLEEDSRLIFLKPPRNDPFRRRSGTTCGKFLKKVFPHHGYFSGGGNRAIKLAYERKSKAERDLSNFKSNPSKWPNGEKMELLETPSQLNELNKPLYEDELIIRNVDGDSTNIRREIERLFPNVSRWFYSHNCIRLRFRTYKEASQTYDKGRGIAINHWKCNILYCRKS